MSFDVGQPVQPPSDNARQCQAAFEAFGCLQAAVLDFASRFEHFEVNFNVPSAAIPLHAFHCILEGMDRDIGQEQPLQRSDA